MLAVPVMVVPPVPWIRPVPLLTPTPTMAPAVLTVKLPKLILELVLPLMTVLAPTRPMVSAFWVAVPIFKATAVALSRVGVRTDVAP